MADKVIIAGGGLAGVLTALALAERRPDVALCLLESGPALGGNHTWSFFESDVAGDAAALVAPLASHRWPGYTVHFGGFERRLSTPYLSLASADLHRHAMARLGARVRLGAEVAALDGGSVTLADGTRLSADAVIDARGPAPLAHTTLRFQTFVGQEVRLARPHGLEVPRIMDARVAQIDGYRFLYVLPLSADTLLIEDTMYTDAPALDRAALRRRIADYAAGEGFAVAGVLREEDGTLPLLLQQDFPAMWRAAAPAGGAVPVGLRAGLFHPVTGYSLPEAARTAVTLAGLDGPLTSARFGTAVAALARDAAARHAFGRLLNRLLFLAGRPEDRHRVLARFHTLPQPLIERFYAGRLTRADRARILFGKPPVPLLAALRALPEASAHPPGQSASPRTSRIE
ncbi:MAG: hypothetical protein AcusKO_15870 [Acuticoccus sp.]